MVRKEILNPLNPEKENTTFLGGANGNDIILSDEINYTFSASDFDDYLYVLTAKFEDLFYVTYLTNGGNVIASQYFVDGERLSFQLAKENTMFLLAGISMGELIRQEAV